MDTSSRGVLSHAWSTVLRTATACLTPPHTPPSQVVNNLLTTLVPSTIGGAGGSRLGNRGGVGGLSESQFFAVISYSTIINSQFPSAGLVRATAQNLADARGQIKQWVAAGTTSTCVLCVSCVLHASCRDFGSLAAVLVILDHPRRGAAMTAALAIEADEVILLSGPQWPPPAALRSTRSF